MHRLCYHCQGMQSLPWHDFVSSQFNSHPDDVNLEDGRRPFHSLVEMRRAKHCQWLRFVQRHGLWVEVSRGCSCACQW